MKKYYVTDAAGPRPDIGGKRRLPDEPINISAHDEEHLYQHDISRGVLITEEEWLRRNTPVEEQEALAEAGAIEDPAPALDPPAAAEADPELEAPQGRKGKGR